ncbi:MAG: hypothetical protein A3F47_01165 [Candidatus Staskawiczbacteria bacterium RIFCSPHIGHO2_12_FULL_38_11]|uniref:Uncharacterized protein n=1 Tax=Candidatus Staskawiczbacteria bacterium RIFCSPHIGHO2_12_FULL_38_11 TaxID=1802209 RepID=A0A1G2I4Z6_9BACT|nr:MAG: hypothetical protein A3F47_01165 [Candidatus Staskawiczbacteria bacterium RIFCSPHIGHO2_12_FULL_38_11]
MEKKKNKKITLDTLASMMEEGFNHVLGEMATKEQLQKVDDRLKNVEGKLEEIGDLRPRVKKLEEALEIE